MPTGLADADRKLLLAGAAIIVIFLVATAVLAPPPEEFESPVPSTYSTQSAGAAAAYRLLNKLHYPIRRWENPPTELDAEGGNILLVLAAPMQPPSAAEKRALADFVADGGHVLFTGSGIGEYFPEAKLAHERSDPSPKSFAPNLPTRITRHAPHVSLQPQAVWKHLNADQFQLYGESGASVVVSWPRGGGNILWWAGSTPLTNAGITREDNLAFFLNSVGNWESGEPYKIYWDEYFHGQRSSLWGYVAKTALAWSGIQLAILALAILWTFGRRSGPVFVPAAPSRLSPLEFVDTLGGLYERAGAASSAIGIAALRLRTLLARQLGMAVNASTADLSEAAEMRLGWKKSGLRELLARVEAASRDVRSSPHEALEMVQKLEAFAGKLDVRSQIRQEKT